MSIITQSLTHSEGPDDSPRLETAQTRKPSNSISTSGSASFFAQDWNIVVESQNPRIWEAWRWRRETNVHQPVSLLKAALLIATTRTCRWPCLEIIILFYINLLFSQNCVLKSSVNRFQPMEESTAGQVKRLNLFRAQIVLQLSNWAKLSFTRLASAHRPTPTSPSPTMMFLCPPLPYRCRAEPSHVMPRNVRNWATNELLHMFRNYFVQKRDCT